MPVSQLQGSQAVWSVAATKTIEMISIYSQLLNIKYDQLSLYEIPEVNCFAKYYN